MKKLIFFYVIFCLYSCKHKEINCIRPFSARENRLIDSIKHQGQIVEMNRLNYFYEGDSIDYCSRYITGTYSITIRNIDSVYVHNQDSMRLFTRKLAAKLYTYVIEDSILMYTEDFWFDFVRKPYVRKKKLELNNATSSCDYLYSVTLKKEDLEKYFGFKVIKTGTGYSREKVQHRTDSLVFTNEHYSRCE